MVTKIKAKDIATKAFNTLNSALGGRIDINDSTYVEIFGGQFGFVFRKDKNYVTIVFSGKKPKITATKGIWVFQMDFEGDILEISFNKDGGFLKLDGLPQQNFEFI
jgi:hypothetical protein